jgi:uncharacterized protein (DUF3084 family)
MISKITDELVHVNGEVKLLGEENRKLRSDLLSSRAEKDKFEDVNRRLREELNKLRSDKEKIEEENSRLIEEVVTIRTENCTRLRELKVDNSRLINEFEARPKNGLNRVNQGNLFLQIPEDPVFGTRYYLCFFIFFRW